MRVSLRLIFVLVLPVLGQNGLESSGNPQLKGTFAFRHLVLNRFDGAGKVIGARAESGQIEFDGAGHYRLTGSYIDSDTASSPEEITVDGTYSIGAGGFGFLSDPESPQDASRNIYGAFAQDVFTGSATENGTTVDFFAAIRLGNASTLAAWTGDYWIASIDFRHGREDVLKNARSRVTADGHGALADFTVTGRSANHSPPAFADTIRGARYSTSNNGFAVTFPAPAGESGEDALLSQDVQMWISPDGAFLLGYSPLGYDVFFGVRALAQPAAQSVFQGTYFLTAIEDQIHGDGASVFYGSEFDPLGAGDEVRHQRVASNRFQPFDYIYDNHTSISADGTVVDFNGYRIAFGNDGGSFIATHNGAFSLLVGNRSSEMPPTGSVAISPIGVLNAASYAPATVPIAPGELLAIFGSGLAPAKEVIAGGLNLPLTLRGVRVLINGVASPIVGVSPTQLAVLVPFGLAAEGRPVATIQVDNNGTLSNIVTMFVTKTMPGLFTTDQDGTGFAVAVHSNGSLVSPDQPADPGEYLAMFLTGLGTVAPAVDGGTVADPKNLSQADVQRGGELRVFSIQPTAIFNSSDVAYAGLAPGFAGLYQMNARVPLRAGPGDQVHIEMDADQVIVRQRWVPVNAGPTNSSANDVATDYVN